MTSHSTIRRASSPCILSLLFVVVAMLAAACGSDADDSAASSDTAASDDSAMLRAAQEPAEEPADEPQSEPEMEMADDQGDFGAAGGEAQAVTGLTTGSAAQPVSALPDIGRDIIYTADLELGSTDVTGATREAIRAVEARGGFLFSQDTRGGSGGLSVLVFKILPDQFQAALNDLGSIGSVRSQSISADDVTAVVVDLESRITTADASVRRLRNLLEEADDFEIIASLENQLLQRETTLEQLRGQLRTVQNQVDLATITVRVTELLNRPGMSLQVSTFGGHDGGFGCFDRSTGRSTEPGSPTTICYSILNTGDTPLIDLTLDDPAFGASIGDLVVVDGTPTQLNPGESLILAHEFELAETVRVRTAVTATALDTDGNPLEDEVKATGATFVLDIEVVDDGFPGFGETLSSSLDALKTIAIVVALVAVAIAPFVAVGAILFGATWLIWRRREPRTTDRGPRPEYDDSKIASDDDEATEATPQLTSDR